MSGRIQPDAEWRAQELYLRHSSHADNARSFGDMAQCARWRLRAFDAAEEFDALVRERESKS